MPFIVWCILGLAFVSALNLLAPVFLFFGAGLFLMSLIGD